MKKRIKRFLIVTAILMAIPVLAMSSLSTTMSPITGFDMKA